MWLVTVYMHRTTVALWKLYKIPTQNSILNKVYTFAKHFPCLDELDTSVCLYTYVKESLACVWKCSSVHVREIASIFLVKYVCRSFCRNKDGWTLAHYDVTSISISSGTLRKLFGIHTLIPRHCRISLEHEYKQSKCLAHLNIVVLAGLR